MDPQATSMSPEASSSPLSLTRSLDLSSSTFDELTHALSDLNNSASTEPDTAVRCCCGKEDCQNTASWLAVKSHLESRLFLSAEVGQALLKKHEEYVSQLERTGYKRRRSQQFWRPNSNTDDNEELSSEEKLHMEYEQLAKEKAELEKRLNVALVNNEVTEVSSKALLQELQESRETISRLTAHHARSMGWDARLNAALKERDDMQQERDSESHRARLAESRFAALKDKANKVQNEVRRLQEALEEKRQHRLESSESIISEARSRLESVRGSMGTAAQAEQDGLTSVLETLVNDNDVLKRDNAELQRLLTESREDLHMMQEELEEQRANMYPPPRSGPSTPLTRHFHSASVSSLSPHTTRRSIGQEQPSRLFHTEPLTPDSARRPLSPLDALAPVDSRWSAFSQASSRRSPASAQLDYDLDEDAQDEDGPDSDKPRAHRQLLLLTRSRGVQTDPFSGPGLASPFPSQMSHLSLSTPPDPRSESSSYSESLSSHVTTLFDRATSLLQRMTQADALTLTNRLKRQHLKGADVNHLSRTTVSNIVAEAIELRAQFRSLLEDEKIVVTCTRKDLRVLFKLFKDMFMELGQLRVTLNDVILDPSCAQRVSENALNPTKPGDEKENGGNASGPSWIAPLSRLFSGTQRREISPVAAASRSNSGLVPTRAPRLAPKLGPALAASTTTVNVEFSGSGIGRATTTIAAPQIVTSAPSSEAPSVAPSGTASVMDIFAGAPKPSEDPWVVLPRAGPRRVQSSYLQNTVTGTATVGRSNFKKAALLPRNLDAIVDSEQRLESVLPEESEEAVDEVAPLQGYPTLRRRGLSDSSIHSTFTTHGEDGPLESPSSPKRASIMSDRQDASGGVPQWYDGNSVFQALSRTVQNLRLATSGSASGVGAPDMGSSQGVQAPSSAASVLQRSTAPTTTASSSRPTPSPSIHRSMSSDPSSPVVEAPSPRSGTPQPEGAGGSSRPLTPQGTPRSSKLRPKVITPRRSVPGDSGLVGSFLPNLNLASWMPAAGDVMDNPGDSGDPFRAATGALDRSMGPTAEGGTLSGRRRMVRPREARTSRDFL